MQQLKKLYLQFLTKNDSFLRLLAKTLLFLYRATLAPLIGGHCRFYPSCSQYAHEAYDKYSFFLATQIVVKRLIACHPFGRSGFDPVPEENHHG